MDYEFTLLREAMRNCVEQLGASRDDELFEFRNAATYTTIHQLITEYDRLRERQNVSVATHAFGTLTADEAGLLQAYRDADDRSKQTIQIAAEVTLQVAEKFEASPRCDVHELFARRTDNKPESHES